MQLIADGPYGRIEFDGNELFITAKASMADPPKVRLGAEGGGTLGCVSFDYVDPETGRREELGMLKVEKDERYRIAPDVYSAHAGYLKVFLRNTEDHDNGMQCVLELGADARVLTTRDQVPSPAPREMLRSADGQYRLVLQGDGNLVLYRADDAVLWASGTVVLT